jgi:hypothetical protein
MAIREIIAGKCVQTRGTAVHIPINILADCRCVIVLDGEASCMVKRLALTTICGVKSH